MQIAELFCAVPLTLGQTEALLLLGGLISCWAAAALTAALSAVFRSEFPALVGVLAFLVAGSTPPKNKWNEWAIVRSFRTDGPPPGRELQNNTAYIIIQLPRPVQSFPKKFTKRPLSRPPPAGGEEGREKYFLAMQAAS